MKYIFLSLVFLFAQTSMALSFSKVPNRVLTVASQNKDIKSDSTVQYIKTDSKAPNIIRAVEKRIKCGNMPKDFKENKDASTFPKKFPGTSIDYGHSPSNPGMVYYREYYHKESPRHVPGELQNCYSYTLYEFKKVGECQQCAGNSNGNDRARVGQ